MTWKYNWLEWVYYHCKKKNVNKYRDMLQHELDKNFIKKERHCVNRRKRDIQIIVSLTSIPERLPYLQYPIRCMLHQTVKPDKIVLYLNKEKMNDAEVPAELLQLRENGLEIAYVEDLGPHTKYFYALQTYKDCYVITIDDDKIYSRTVVKELLKTEKKHQGAICARRVVSMKFSQRGIPYPYSSYGEFTDKAMHGGKNLLALGVGGVLYPPHCLEQAEFNITVIRKIAHNNDDIWLKSQELLLGLDVVKVGCLGMRDISVQGTQVVALCKGNHAYGNNEILKNVFTHYDLYHYYADSTWMVDAGTDAIARRILIEWLTLYQKNIGVGDWLIGRGVRSVAIYGMAKLGRLLQKELEAKGIEVKYGIDVRELYDTLIPMVKPQDISEPVDMIIVTAITDFSALKHRLKQYMNCEIEMLENIIVEILWENT